MGDAKRSRNVEPCTCHSGFSETVLPGICHCQVIDRPELFVNLLIRFNGVRITGWCDPEEFEISFHEKIPEILEVSARVDIASSELESDHVD
jgi:hypothetical protein